MRMLLRKNDPPGFKRFKSTATMKESAHTSGVQMSDSSKVFFSPSRNISFFQIFM